MPSPSHIPDGSPVGRNSSLHTAVPRNTSCAFGSPGTDSTVKRIDLTDALIRHPDATFMMRAAGDSMVGAGIADGDVLLVDCAVRAADGAIVIAIVDGEPLCRRFEVTGTGRGARHRVRLLSADGVTPAIQVSTETLLEVRGVVTTVIKSLLV